MRHLSILAATACIAFGAAAAERPVYRTVKAEKIRPREGIGHTMRKINAGGDVTVAYLGGSITAADGWRPKTTAWLRKRHPGATFKEIHAAIGGTGSDLGVYRLERDALRHAPDLLFVEFAVNDGGASPEAIWRSMEGIVRQTWRRNPETDILFVYTIHLGMADELRKGNCPRSASAMELLADHYGIPSVNVALPVVELMEAGKLIFKADTKPEGDLIWFAGDDCHPRDEGHELYTALITQALDQMASAAPADRRTKLDTCFVPDHLEAAKMIPLRRDMLEGNWLELPADHPRQRSFGNRLGQIWMAEEPGCALTFKFRGTEAQIYDLLGPDGGQVTITVDGKPLERPIPRFDSYCTYHRLASLRLFTGQAPAQTHTIRIEIHPEQPDRKSVAFRLKDPDKELAEPKYQGTRVWMGQLMLTGDLVTE